MIIRTVDSIMNDWSFGKGLNDYKTGVEAIKENIKTRLQSWTGDCFFAVNDGVDYNNLLDIGTKSLLDIDIKRVILQSEGVIKINTFTSEITDRGYTCNVSLISIYGQIYINV